MIATCLRDLINKVIPLKIGKYKAPGWEKALDIYRFWCNVKDEYGKPHGWMFSYASGYSRVLICRKCRLLNNDPRIIYL